MKRIILMLSVICCVGFTLFGKGKSVSLDEFLSSEVFKPVSLGSKMSLYSFSGSKSLLDEIKIGDDNFGSIMIAGEFEDEEGIVRKTTGGMVLDSSYPEGKIITSVTQGYVEFDFEVRKFEDAFSLELKEIRNKWDRPIRYFEFKLRQISPFFASDFNDSRDSFEFGARRAARFAEDGRYMGVVSSAGALLDIKYGSAKGGANPGDGIVTFEPMKAGRFLSPGESVVCKDVWVCYLLGRDSRDGWRSRTDRLRIFSSGTDKVSSLAKRRKHVFDIGGKKIVRGSVDLDPAKAVPITDETVKRRLVPESAGQILEIDISHIDISSWRRLSCEFNLLNRGKCDWNEIPPRVYYDSKPLKLSVWPNDGWASIAKFGASGRVAGAALFQEDGSTNSVSCLPTFYYSGSRPERWKEAKNFFLCGFWAYDWLNTLLPVEKIDTEQKCVHLAAHSAFGVRSGNSDYRRWRAYNLIEEIDAPGEYAIDMDAKKLYFFPPEGFSRQKRFSIAVGDKKALFVCSGLKDVEFRDIVFEESYSCGVMLENCENVVFSNCVFRCIMRDGVNIGPDCRNCAVVDCVIEDMGFGGAYIAGGEKDKFVPGCNVMEGCTVRRTSDLLLKTSSAVRLVGVGNAIRDVVFSDIPDMAVLVNGCALTLDSCVISNVCIEVDDYGAYYQGRNASNRGNVIKNCTFIDVGANLGHGTAAIYFDDGDSGSIVFSNTFIRCGYPGRGGFGTVFSHGGFENYVKSCRFVDCIRPFGSLPWNEEKWDDFFKNHEVRDVRKMANNPIFVAAFPEIGQGFSVKNAEKKNYATDCFIDGSPIWRETVVKGELKPAIIYGNWVTNKVEVVRPRRWSDAIKFMDVHRFGK